jgi:hypothetical protein
LHEAAIVGQRTVLRPCRSRQKQSSQRSLNMTPR